MNDLTPAEEAVRDEIWIRLDGREWAKTNYDGAARAAVAAAGPILEAKALREFADAHRFPHDWIMFRRNDGSGVTVSDRLREAAAGKLGEPTSATKAGAEAAGLIGAHNDLADRNERLKAARALVEVADLPPGSLDAAVSLLEDMVIEVDHVRGEVEEARAEAERLRTQNDVLVTEVRFQGERAEKHREEARMLAVDNNALKLVPDRARFDEVVAEMNQAIEAWGKAEEERDTARRTAEHYRAMKCAVCGRRAAYVNAAGEVIGWGCADGDTCVDPPGPRQAYRDAIEIALNALSRWPWDGRADGLQARRNLRKLADALDTEPRTESAGDRPAGRRSASRFALEQPLVKRSLPDFLREAGHVTLADAVQRTKDMLAATPEDVPTVDEPGTEEREPTLRDVMAAAYRNGLGLRKEVDDHETRSYSDEPDRREHWHLREWSITNAHGRQVGRFELETGPRTYVRLTSRRDPSSEKGLLTDPTIGDVLDAARAAGLITK
jgi:hypothetical protein